MTVEVNVDKKVAVNNARTPQNLALFDLDHTLIPIDSDYEWGEFTIALGWC
ncbi:MAG: HAD-IB family hydrolase, partial [Polaromonas sp.]